MCMFVYNINDCCAVSKYKIYRQLILKNVIFSKVSKTLNRMNGCTKHWQMLQRMYVTVSTSFILLSAFHGFASFSKLNILFVEAWKNFLFIFESSLRV